MQRCVSFQYKPLTYLRFSSSFSCSAKSREADCTATFTLGVTVAAGVPVDEATAELAFFRGDDADRAVAAFAV